MSKSNYLTLVYKIDENDQHLITELASHKNVCFMSHQHVGRERDVLRDLLKTIHDQLQDLVHSLEGLT